MGTSNNRSGVSSGVFGLLIGGLVGVGVGLLIAPEKGQQVRRRLAYQLNNVVDKLSDLVEQVSRIQEDSEARRQGAALVEEATEQARKILHEADALMNEVRRNPEAGRTAS